MTAARSDHDDLRDTAALYLLGALDQSEAKRFETHLASCAECVAEVQALRPTVAVLADAVPQLEPPPALRARVLSSVDARQPSPPVAVQPAIAPYRWAPWLVAAASLIAAIGLGAYSWQLRGQLDSLTEELGQARSRLESTEREIENARRMASDAQATVRVIAAPDLLKSDLAGQPVAPRSSARAFWSRSRGLVFTASDLPPLPVGRTYQLWFVTSLTPLSAISATTFTPDANGQVETTIATPPDVARAVALAVTIEPSGGVPAPSGERYLVGTVSGL
jgi:anti-sigma-K factor RskA